MKDASSVISSSSSDDSQYSLHYSPNNHRCKSSWMRSERRIYSKQSNNRLSLYLHEDDNDEDEDEDHIMEAGKKRKKRRYNSENKCKCCSPEMKKKKKKTTKKTKKKLDQRDNSNRRFSEEHHIFKMKEMKLKRKKKEAEKHILQLMKDMRVYEIEFDKLFDEIDEKKKQVVVAEGKVKEYEFIKTVLEDEDCEYDKTCYEFKERVCHLEKGLANACKREKGLQQRIRELENVKTQQDKGLQDRIRELECTYTRAESEIEFWKKMFKDLETRVDKGLQERIRELECVNRRAESEIEFWKKMFKDLETRVLVEVEPQALSKIFEEPRRVCSQVSYAEEQQKNEGETNSTLQEVKDKIFVSHSLAKESGQLRLSENGKNTESTPRKIQIEPSCAVSGTCSAPAPSKIKEEGLNCDLGENVYASILLSLSQESRVSEPAVSEGINNSNKVGNSSEETSTVVIRTSCIEDEPTPVDTKIVQLLNSRAHCRPDFRLFL